MATNKVVKSVGFEKDLLQVNHVGSKGDGPSYSNGRNEERGKGKATMDFPQTSSPSVVPAEDDKLNPLLPLLAKSSIVAFSTSCPPGQPSAQENDAGKEVEKPYRNGRVFYNDSRPLHELKKSGRKPGSNQRRFPNSSHGFAQGWGDSYLNQGSRFGRPHPFPKPQNHLTPEIKWHGEPLHEVSPGFYITTTGIVSIQLRPEVRVDLTVEQGIRIINVPKGIIVALNANGTQAALIHPCGRVYQYGSRVEIATSDSRAESKFAKMWHRGVSFTSEQCSLIYLVDDAGTRSIVDTFSDTSGDFSVPVFLSQSNSKSFALSIGEWHKILPDMQYWTSPEGCENWVINGIRISITMEGLVRVTRGPTKYNLRVGMTGTASITTPYVHATASITETNSHLFAKRGERRMHYDGNNFIVRNGGHSSGMDCHSELKLSLTDSYGISTK